MVIKILNIIINAEVWRDIPGFNNWYQVSNTGKIRSKQKIVYSKNGVEKVYRSKELKLRLNNKGYAIVDLYNEKIKYTCLVHRIVALEFVYNLNKEKFNLVNHLDGNKTHNEATNLEWTDNSGNMMHSYNVLHKNNRYHSGPISVSIYEPNTDELLYTFDTIKEASEFIGRDASIIRRLINSNNNIKYGYRWEKSSTTIERDPNMLYIDIILDKSSRVELKRVRINSLKSKRGASHKR